MNQNLGGYLNIMACFLGRAGVNPNTEEREDYTPPTETGSNLITDDGTLLVTDDGTELIYA